jgi:RNA polymerase sigma factor for flagellar operon FliA
MGVRVDMPAEDEPSLWRRWRADRAPDARERLVLRYSGWARAVARKVFVRVRGRPGDWHDYVQNALTGLLQAIDAFDPAFGVPFSAFAVHRVRGAVFDGLRDLRSTGSETMVSTDTEDRVSSVLESTGDPLDQLIAAVSQLAVGAMLQAGADVSAEQTPYEVAEQAVLNRWLRRTLSTLPDRERSVIELHYLQFVPFVRIAELMEVTKGRVSQLHRQGLGRMRDALAGRRLVDVL